MQAYHPRLESVKLTGMVAWWVLPEQHDAEAVARSVRDWWIVTMACCLSVVQSCRGRLQQPWAEKAVLARLESTR